MDAESRRENILHTIRSSTEPLTGAQLARKFDVSRQVIVQDIAILRAAGNEIIATPQGYIMPSLPRLKAYRRVMAIKHSSSDMEDELMTIVDLGGKVLDVIIEHPFYGEFKGLLMIKSPSDVRSFIAKMKEAEAEPLSALTEGVHLHTIEADSPEILDKIEKALKDKGYLL